MKNRVATRSIPVNLPPPKRLSRLILILAIATLHLTSIGAGVVQAGKHRWVDTHWDRGLSYLKLGWRWRRQQYQRGGKRLHLFGWTLRQTHSQFLPLVELYSQGRKALTSQLLCELSGF
jgi:hypothetical protein